MNTGLHKTVYDRVKWWLEDMAYKPPEVLNDHYYETMATDIANIAVGDEPVSHERLDNVICTRPSSKVCLDPKCPVHG